MLPICYRKEWMVAQQPQITCPHEFWLKRQRKAWIKLTSSLEERRYQLSRYPVPAKNCCRRLDRWIRLKIRLKVVTSSSLNVTMGILIPRQSSSSNQLSHQLEWCSRDNPCKFLVQNCCIALQCMKTLSWNLNLNFLSRLLSGLKEVSWEEAKIMTLRAIGKTMKIARRGKR